MPAQSALDLLRIGPATGQSEFHRPGLFALLFVIGRPEDEPCPTRREAGNLCLPQAAVLWLAAEHIAVGDLDLRALRAPGCPAPPRPPAQVEVLSHRELEVLRLLPSELSIPQIAEYLVVPPSTVRTHVKHIFGKLGAHTRDGAVAYARDLGLL